MDWCANLGVAGVKCGLFHEGAADLRIRKHYTIWL